MVKKIITYQCEWPGCKEVYPSKTQAEKCQAKGIIGPEIKPGLITTGLSSGYNIFFNNSIKGHERTYEFLRISNNLNHLKKYEEWYNSTGVQVSKPILSFDDWNIRALDCFLKQKDIKLLEKNEFRDISNMIHNNKIFKEIRTNFLETRIEKFYRTHPYFQK